MTQPMPDEYQTASLVNGLPTATFRARPFHRTVTNIVVGNGIAGAVTIYRGQLGSVPVGQNTAGDSNTIRGTIPVPAGQPLYVVWSVAGSPVSSAFARVSAKRADNPSDAVETTATDWDRFLVTSMTIPSGATTGTPRIVFGGDTPAELSAYGIDVAIRSYITDHISLLEVGYFFIGTSNRFDGNGDNRVQAFGNVLYPTPGVPSSAVVSSVKTNFQQQMFQPYPQTIFKDQKLELWTDFNLRTQNGFNRMTVGDLVDNLVVNIDKDGIKAAQPTSAVIETWHDFVYQNLWANSAAGQVTGRYRRLVSPANSVQIVGECAAGTKADTTIITNLPVGYRPAKGTTIPIAVNPSTAAGSTTPLLQLKANGDLICFGLVAATGTIYFSAILPLDA